MSYFLGKSSLKNIEGVHPRIKLIVLKAIQLTECDFGIIQNGGLRTAEMQNDLFLSGKSKCDGYIKRSFHQSGCAVDLVPYIDGKYTWKSMEGFIQIYNSFIEAEKILKLSGDLPENVYFHHGLLWGYKDINHNKKIDISDKLGWDCAHHEMRSKPQIIKL